MIPVTMIPGDGVGPELMDSVQAVVKSTGAPINFEIKHLSEVQHWNSLKIEEVQDSVIANKVAIKGVINAPDINFEGEMQNLNQQFRKNLDLYANVVKVIFKFFDHSCYTHSPTHIILYEDKLLIFFLIQHLFH